MFVLLGANITEFEQKMNKASSKMQSTGRGFTDMGRTLTKAITLPLTILSGVALKAAIDFESAFAGVRKTVNATEAEFEVFRRGILDMSKILPASAIEIANVAEKAGQLGISNEALLEFTRTMIDLGETTDLASDQAATALARVANIMGTSQNQFRNLGSSIVALGNNLATTESEIVTMTLRLAAAAKQVGITEAETLAFAGALSQVGVQAQAGGTAFSKVFIEISKSVALGNKKLKEFAKVAGLSVDEFSKLFKDDAAEAVILFVEGLGRVQESGKNVFLVLENLGIQERRMANALLATANSGDKLRAAIDLSTKAWKENTALTEEAGKRYETTAAQLSMTKNSAIAAAIALGDTMKGALLSVITPLRGVFDWLEKLAIGFNSLPAPIRITVGGFVALAAILPVVLFGMGAVTKAIPLLILGIDGVTKALAFLAAHPVVIALAVIAGLIATIILRFQAATTITEIFTESIDRLRQRTQNAAIEMATWSEKALLAKKALLELELQQAKTDLRIQSAIAGVHKNARETEAYEQKLQQLSTRITELNFELIATTNALNSLADAEEDAGGGADSLATRSEKIVEIYEKMKAAIFEVANRQRVMGKEFNTAKEEVGILEEAMIQLLNNGVNPASEGFQKLAARLKFMREQAENFKLDPVILRGLEPPEIPDTLEDPFASSLDSAEDWAIAIEQIVKQGMTGAASAFLEGIGQIAAGKATLSGVLASVLSTLGEMAIRVGRIAIGTGIAISGIRKALESLNPLLAIAAGVALIALGSFVKASLSGIASGGGGGGGFGASIGGSTGTLSNFTPRFPRDDLGRVRDREAESRSDFGLGKQAPIVTIVPASLPSGDIEYSIRESGRRAERRGTDII